jgi:parallel beta-helix repeat protein
MTTRPAILSLFSLFSLFVLTGVAQASITVLSPVAGNDNQVQISQAIKAENENGGGTVYLSSGVYDISGPIIIKSNIRLTGDQDAIIRVWAPDQWFTGQTGIICNPEEVISNVEIDSFQIDGNIKNLPREYDSTPGHKRDCEKLILFGGWSNSFGSNIKIHNMRLYNAFSDGIYIRFAKGVLVYDNIISNCQHEGIYFSCVVNGTIHGNEIAGITSDCARLDNCQNCKIHDNIFFAYTGDSFGAYKGGHNGLQIGDAGVSHGYDARNKPFRTKNIEVFNNIFSDPGLRAIWYHAGENVYIHDNKFVNADELETLGVPIGDISPDNPPTVEDSLTVFDLLRLYKGQTSINDNQDMIKNDPVKTQEDKKAFFSPVVWLFLLIVIILLYGIKINLAAAFKW